MKILSSPSGKQARKIARTSLILIALVFVAIVAVAMLYSRTTRSPERLAAGNWASEMLTRQLRDSVKRAQASGYPPSPCEDLGCEVLFPGMTLPEGMFAKIEVSGDKVLITASHELGDREYFWDSSSPDKIDYRTLP